MSTQCEGYPLIGAHPRRKCPAVRRGGYTALMYAAACDHHEIVGRLIVARADLNTKAKDTDGCAHSPRPVRRRRRSPTLPIAPAPSGRWTALHLAAYNGCTKSAVALLVGGAGQTITNDDG